jgi:hypothetical protein
VGRPRKEQAQLTVEDLGGDKQTSYTVSGNVMDALEAFRAEEETQMELEGLERKAHSQSTWFGKKQSKADKEKLETLRKKLGSSGVDGDSLGRSSSHHSGHRTQKPESAITRKLFVYAAITASLILLVVGGNMAYGKIQQYLAERDRIPDVESNAMQILAAGRPPIEALIEVNASIKKSDTEFNKDVAFQVRARFSQGLQTLLTAEEFDMGKLHKASDLVDEAMDIDKSPKIRSLYAQIETELAIHKMTLRSIDGTDENKTATFSIYPSGEQTVKIGANPSLQDRFKVTHIEKNFVLLEDTKVEGKHGRGRKLKAPLNSSLVKF